MPLNFNLMHPLPPGISDMSLTTALTVFCRKVEQERKIPFEITAEATDPFYSESNMRYLKKKMEDYKAGRLNLVEHDLIEE